MTNLTPVEKYTMFVLKNKEKIDSYIQRPFIRGLIILDMFLEGYVQINEKNKITATGKEPSISYYSYIWYDLKNINQEINLTDFFSGKIVDIKIGSINRFFIHENIIDKLSTSLIDKDLVTKTSYKTIFGEKEKLEFKEDCFNELLKLIRADVLESDELSEKDMLLISMLHLSTNLKNIFSKYEMDSVKEKIKKVKQSKLYKTIFECFIVMDNDSIIM